jgi:hypothetical protein
MFHRTIIVFVACAWALLGQEFGLGPLISGFVFDPAAKGIRPFFGIPGGGYVGQAVVSGLDAAWAAPDGNAAVVVKDAQAFLVRNLKGGEPAWSPLESASVPLVSAWSADSVGFATYSQSSGALRLYTLRGVELDEQVWHEAAVPDEPVAAIAVSRRGREVFFVREAGDAAGLYVASPGAAPRWAAPVGNAAGMAFTNRDQDLVIAQKSPSGVVLVKDAAGAAAYIPLALELDASSDLAGVACSPDGRRVFVADRGTRTLLTFDLEAGTLESRTSLEFAPSRTERLSNGALFLLSTPEDIQPLYVLDAGPVPGVYFVPAAGPAAEGE